jgi:hypothetical protein
MRNIDARLRKLEGATAYKPIATIWWDKQSEAELEAEVAEQEAKGFQVVVVSWKRDSGAQSATSDICEPPFPHSTLESISNISSNR